MRIKGIIGFVFLWGVALGQEKAVPATQVTAVGGFVGGRLEKNRDNFLKTFPIGNYVTMLEERKHTAWDWRQGEQPGKLAGVGDFDGCADEGCCPGAGGA
ncbi:hypothetical protein ACQ86N_33315 [Puia sp. P3]|uniref:hypothetical protein n=1 Tax=Puia sp. P3 TaxID=3423952 RepID=UPI003D67F95F